MPKRRSQCPSEIRPRLRTGSPCLVALFLCALLSLPSAGKAREMFPKSDFESLYEPGIPPFSMEWSFPTGFSLGIDSGYRLRIGDESPVSSETPKVNTFPLSFSMKYNLYENKRISQSIGVGLGPYFLHEGEMPIQIKDLDVTGSSTCATEWVSHISKDMYLKLKMKYSRVFETVVHELPLWDFTTWLGLHLRW